MGCKKNDIGHRYPQKIVSVDEYLLEKAINTSRTTLSSRNKKVLIEHWKEEMLLLQGYGFDDVKLNMVFSPCSVCEHNYEKKGTTLNMMEVRLFHKIFYWVSLTIFILGIGIMLGSTLTVFNVAWQTGLIISFGGLTWLIPISHLINRIQESNHC